MNSQLVKEFGPTLSTRVLPVEIERRDCPSALFPVILLLRMLLGDSVSVFYKTMWEADDGNTHYTDIFLYDAGSPYRKASFTKIATAHVDTAISVSWRTGETDPWDGTDSYRDSYGVIRWLSIDSAFGATTVDAKDAVLTFLQLAASSSSDYELRTEAVEEGVVSLKLWPTTEESEAYDIGLLHWSTTETRCSRFWENRGDCAFELK